MKIGSQFSGIGAFEQAFKNLGIDHNTVMAVEWDKYARQTYTANFGEPKHFYRDTYDADYENVEQLDCFLSSPPCQAFSLSGKRLGEKDDRGILFYETYRFIKLNQPKYFIIENVKGLLSIDDGNVFNNWINLLGQSVNGDQFMFPHEDSLMYNLHWQVLNTKDYGIPQNRERVFLVGIRNDLPNNFVFPKPIPLKLRLKDILEDEVDEKFYLSEKMLNYLTTRKDNFNNGKINFKGENDIASCINASSSSLDISDNILKVENIGNVNPSGNGMNGNVFSENGISPTLTTNKGEGIKIQIASATKSGYETATEIIQLNNPTHSNDRIYSSEGLSPTLNTMQGGNRQPFIAELKIGAFRGRNPQNPTSRESGLATEQMLEINENGTSNCLTSVQKDDVVFEYNNKKNIDYARQKMRILLEAVSGDSTEKWLSYVSSAIKEGCLLQSRMYEESLFYKPSKNRWDNNQNQQSESTEIKTRRLLRDLWKGECYRCSPQRRESIKQLFRELAEALSVVSCNYTSSYASLQSRELQFETEGIRLLQQTLYPIQKVWTSNDVLQQNYRIRKLTTLEVFRLQGFPDVFHDKAVAAGVSNSQLYKQAGNSITVAVIQAILKNLLKN